MKYKKIIKKLKNNITPITLMCYGLGLILNYLYYNKNDIPIIYYLNLNDLLLSPLIIIIIIFFIVFLYHSILYQSVYPALNEYYLKRDKEIPAKIFKRWVYGLILITWTPILVFYYFFSPVSINALIIVTLVPIILLNYFSETRNLNGVSLFFLILSFSQAISLSISTVETSEQETKISFIYEDDLKIDTRTDKCIYYLGETSTHIFIRNKDKKTNVYPKEHIRYITYY